MAESDQGTGNAAQTRAIAEQVAEATIALFATRHPELQEAKVPPPLKLAAAIVVGILTTGSVALAGWLVFTVSDMQVTLGRMDERMGNQSASQVDRYADLERRVAALELDMKDRRK